MPSISTRSCSRTAPASAPRSKRSSQSSRSRSGCGIARSTSTRTIGVERPAPDRLLDRLEQVARVLVGEVQLRGAGEAEEPRALDPPLGIDEVEVGAHHVFQRDEVVRVGDRQEARDPLRQPQVGEVQRPGAGVLEHDREERREVRHHRHREPRAHRDRPRREQREDLALELRLEQGAAGRRQLPPVPEPNPRLGQRGQARGERPILPREQRPHPDADRLELRLARPPRPSPSARRRSPCRTRRGSRSRSPGS